jgi:hypothetical protein
MIQYKPRTQRRQATSAERRQRKAVQQIEGRVAMAEYEQDRQAVLERMAKLRKAREDRERQG